MEYFLAFFVLFLVAGLIPLTVAFFLFMLNDPDGKEIEIPEPSQSSGAEAGPETQENGSSTSQRS